MMTGMWDVPRTIDEVFALRFFMLQELVVWFNDRGADPFAVKVKVEL
jgi:hypothetical protein